MSILLCENRVIIRSCDETLATTLKTKQNGEY